MSLVYVVRASIVSAALLLSSTALSDVTIVAPKSKYAQDVAEQIKAGIKHPVNISDTLNQDANSKVVVALGKSSFEKTVGTTSLPIVGILSYTDAPPISDRPSYFVYSDPSPKDIAVFLKKHFQNMQIGYIYTEDESNRVEQIKEQLIDSSTQLITIKSSSDVFGDIRALTRTGKGIDAMLVTTNRNIYKPEKIRFVLESLFRKKVPVISTSAFLIEPGATVAISPSADAISAEASKIATLLHSKDTTPRPSGTYIDDLDIKVNSSMSEYFNLDFGEESK